jgi:hypothetical protein
METVRYVLRWALIGITFKKRSQQVNDPPQAIAASCAIAAPPQRSMAWIATPVHSLPVIKCGILRCTHRFLGKAYQSLGIVGCGMAPAYAATDTTAGAPTSIAYFPIVVLLIVLLLLWKTWQRWRDPTTKPYEWETYTPEVDARIDSAGVQVPLATLYADDFGGVHRTIATSQYAQILGCDVERFITEAKARFIALQIAWDHADLPSLEKATTPHLFTALRQQVMRSDRIKRHTDVVKILCTLIAIRQVDEGYLASLHFEGLMKPMPDASAEIFDEIWHVEPAQKPSQDWLVAGIQKIV